MIVAMETDNLSFLVSMMLLDLCFAYMSLQSRVDPTVIKEMRDSDSQLESQSLKFVRPTQVTRIVLF